MFRPSPAPPSDIPATEPRASWTPGRHAGPPLASLLAPGLLTALALGLLLVRELHTGREAFRGMAWNLFLAWTPLAVALGLRLLAGPGRAPARLLLPAAGAWLLLLPNAPYVLTDLIHLRPRPGVPLWFDGALLGLFAAAGWLPGLLSLEVFVAEVRARAGRGAALLGLAAVCVLSGYGVFLGRVPRFNSWDVLHAPDALARAVAAHLRAPGAHPGLVSMTALFALLLLASYAALLALRASGPPLTPLLTPPGATPPAAPGSAAPRPPPGRGGGSARHAPARRRAPA
jgi:uncharacterized membrane protein